MAFKGTDKVWMNGKLVEWANANIHVASHVVHYGSAVFEGIRCYKTETGAAVFRLPEHMRRLADSCHIGQMKLPYTVEQLVQACKDTVRSTGLDACYVRPIAYFGYGEMGLNTLPCSIDVAVACWPWGAYLGDDAVTKGVRMKISSWTRHDHNTMPPASKTTGNVLGRGAGLGVGAGRAGSSRSGSGAGSAAAGTAAGASGGGTRRRGGTRSASWRSSILALRLSISGSEEWRVTYRSSSRRARIAWPWRNRASIRSLRATSWVGSRSRTLSSTGFASAVRPRSRRQRACATWAER